MVRHRGQGTPVPPQKPKSMLVGVAARLGETRAALCDGNGTVLESWSHLPELKEDLIFSVCQTDERKAEIENWLQGFGGRLFRCSWPDAALAGAFSGRPGVLLTTEHWTMYAGCAARNGPEAICQALGLAREANHRTLAIANGEGGLEWLCRESLRLLEEVKGPSQHRLQLALASHRGQPTDREQMRSRAVAVRRAVSDLADYPGPDPACLAVLAKTARRLSDLLRRLTSRVRLQNPTRAAWLDGTLDGPLWQAMQVEFEKYLPELHWQGPEGHPEVGAARLALGALKEEQRRALNPAGPGPAVSAALDADAWRQLSRLRFA